MFPVALATYGKLAALAFQRTRWSRTILVLLCLRGNFCSIPGRGSVVWGLCEGVPDQAKARSNFMFVSCMRRCARGAEALEAKLTTIQIPALPALVAHQVSRWPAGVPMMSRWCPL